MTGIIGKKIGMTQLFREDGIRISVTLIEAGPCTVLQVKDPNKDGYAALQIGFGSKREGLVNRPMKGHLKKSGLQSVRVIKELRTGAEKQENAPKTGDVIDVAIFQPGDFVDVTGVSIGKGFQGGIKRWGWAGGKGSHGSMHHRAPGSIGASSFPSRVHKGRHLPGRMGNVQRTVQNLEVVRVDNEKNLMAVKGSVPGNENSYLLIKASIKKKRVEEGKKDEGKKG